MVLLMQFRTVETAFSFHKIQSHNENHQIFLICLICQPTRVGNI